MKRICCFLLLCIPCFLQAQPPVGTKNIFIITTDGFRWQEVFTGADSLLINNPRYVKDTGLVKGLYWDSSTLVRRQKLMPFFWNVIAAKGQLYGNRFFNNKVNVKNFYKISYPGYNEMLTGYPDPRLIPNTPVYNKNSNILEYLNTQEAFRGKVAAFTSWNIFPFILNEERSGLPVNSGYEMLNEKEDSSSSLINKVQDGVAQKKHTRYDMLTYLCAREYIGQHKPRVVFLGLGETDESAHSGRYDLYLQQATMVDKMIADLWYYVQTDPFYKDNTTFIITTDHGRGRTAASWHTHSLFTAGSGETWLAILGPETVPIGEMKNEQQTYEKQLAATVALLLGEKFETSHPVGQAILLPAASIDNITISRAAR
ncbi:MAG TPA: alkaline phosphatase family protein [Chitinophagaceae bacterium]|nr:alkaline phosphatase family protein [Chitinophagaceae bacterium]